MVGDNKQERHEMMMNDLEQIERTYNAYCVTLKYRNLVEYLDPTTAWRRYLQAFCRSQNQGVGEGTFPYPPIDDDDLELFQFW